jgi:hypothetical protein
MPSIIELYNSDFQKVKSTVDAKAAPGDLTPYYSEGKNGKEANLVDEKSISELEKKLSTKRYGPGVGEWGPTYNDSKLYSKVTKKD